MNSTTSFLQSEELNSPDVGAESSQVAVIAVSLAVISILILAVPVLVFVRKRRRSRKIYIPVTSNDVGRLENGVSNYKKALETQSSHNSFLPNIYESLVVMEKETDEGEDWQEEENADADDNIRSAPQHGASENEINQDPGGAQPQTPSKSVPSSRCTEPKHSRSLPSLKHLSAHEEALSYLALNHHHNQNNANNNNNNSHHKIFTTTTTTLGSFLHGENGFIRSRSFNERIAFGLHISRHSLSNKNKINAPNPLNRCMTTNESNGTRSKVKTKEFVKTCKPRNTRGSFIKSFRISQLTDWLPSNMNLKKRLSTSVGKNSRKSTGSSSRSPVVPAVGKFSKSQSFCLKPQSEVVDQAVDEQGVEHTDRGGSATFDFNVPPSTQMRIDRDKMFDGSKNSCLTSEDFLNHLLHSRHDIESGKTRNLYRIRSCMAIFSSSSASHDKSSQNQLRHGNAMSFDQLENYSKKCMD